MKILVTGAAGFVGFHTTRHLLEHVGAEVIGVDNLNDYYPVALKRARLEILAGHRHFRFVRLDFAERQPLEAVFEEFQPELVVHLGAQAGVRYSLQNPQAYTDSNITGFLNILEACRKHLPRHLLYASSSSVYGAGCRCPFSEGQAADQPESLYAATKRANELMAHSYARLFGLNATGVRIFTAYGPWGRPDMAPMLFAAAIIAGQPVKLFNYGKNARDFTYIDDLVEGITRLLVRFQDTRDAPPCRVFNLGHSRPVNMRRFVDILAGLLGREAQIELLPPQPGDMVETRADLSRVREAVGFEPRVPIEEGLKRFVDWYIAHYHRAERAHEPYRAMAYRRAA
jgi:UDP-glucuronate 4-epimerase